MTSYKTNCNLQTAEQLSTLHSLLSRWHQG